MNRNLELKLKENFPDYFVDLYGDPRYTCLAWGCQNGDGWYPILYRLCSKIKELNPSNFKFTQIKEKWGAFSISTNSLDPQIGKLVKEAYEASMTTCENCGTEESVTCETSIDKHWIRTLCNNCREK